MSINTSLIALLPVTAILVVFAITVGTLVKGRMPDMLFVIIPVIAVPLIIRSFQSR